MAEHEYTRNEFMKGFAEGYFETSDGVRLRYLHGGQDMAGKGLPLLMLPGWGSTADVFSLNAPAFAREHELYIIEWRGYGFSECPDHGARVSRLAADLDNFIDYLGLERFDILGWSMGASVIWSYCDLFGQRRINRAIFVDSPPRPVANPKDSPEKILSYGGREMNLMEVYNNMRADFKSALYDIFPHTHDTFTDEQLRSAPDDYYELMKHFPADPPTNEDIEFFLGRLAINQLSGDWRDIFHTLTMPVLLFTGDVSHATTPECGRWMSEQMPDCTWVRISAEQLGDHRLMQRAYRTFDEDVMAFLRGETVPGAEPKAHAATATPAPAPAATLAATPAPASGASGAEAEASAAAPAAAPAAEDAATAEAFSGQLIGIDRVEVGPRTMAARVHIAEGGPLKTNDDPEGTNRILALVPGIAGHACVGDAAPTFGGVVRDTDVAHLLEHVAVELMALTERAGDISRGRTRSVGGRDYEIELDCPDDVLASACLSSAAWLLDWAYSGGEDPVPDVDATVAGLAALYDSVNDKEDQTNPSADDEGSFTGATSGVGDNGEQD